ncbi:hypothetical protein ABBQ38_012817 [Trebouxia sp. C0009 RCD-2024]
MRFVQASLPNRLSACLLQHRLPKTFATLVGGDVCTTPGASEKTGILHEQGVLERELPDLKDVVQDEGPGAGRSSTEDELKQRKSSVVRAWMETQVGADKVEVAQILKDHGALVRGGPEQGQKLMEALVAWKRQPQS